MTAAITTARAARPGTVAAVGVRVALAVQFAAGGLLKLTGSPAMVEMFADIGAGTWLRLLVGAAEIAGAVGLLVPRLAGAAALGLVALLVGASLVNVAVLHTSPAVPVAYLLVAGAIAYSRRASTARLLRALRDRTDR